MTAFPTEYLSANIVWANDSVQNTMEAGSEIHRVSIGFDSVVSKATAKWTAPPAYVATLYDLFCTQGQLIGVYTLTDEVMGAIKVQPDGPLTWTKSSMTRWTVTLPIRRV